jgi:hypothetical protein
MNNSTISKIKVSQFNFFNHDRLQRQFDKNYNHLKVIEGTPDITIQENIVYTPAEFDRNGYRGSLYAQDGTRIEASIVKQGRYQTTSCLDPKWLNIPKEPVDKQTYLYLGWFQPHYGHFITETLSRFWCLTDHLEQDIVLLAHISHPQMLQWKYVIDILSCYGVKPDNICYFNEVTHLGRVIIPGAGLSLESHVYKEVARGYSAMVHQCLSELPETIDQPVYLSRTQLRKGIYYYENEEQIEELMKELGVLVFYPEKMTVHEQVYLFNRYKNIISIIGSAMHNVLFSQTRPNMFYLTSEWVNPTCFLIDSCFSGSSTYVQVCKTPNSLGTQLEKIIKKLSSRPKQRINKFYYRRTIDMVRFNLWVKDSNLFYTRL